MNLTKQSKTADLGKRKTSVRMVQHQIEVDGKLVTVIERIPWGQYLKCVKFNGSVSRIPLHNGCANDEVNDEYKRHIETTKPRRGGVVPYGRCLQTLDSDILEGYMPKWHGPGTPIVPEELRNRPACRTAADGKSKIDNNHPCQCIVDLIAYRKAQNAERMGLIEQRSAADRQADAAEGMVEAVAGLAQVVKGMQDASQPKRGKAPE